MDEQRHVIKRQVVEITLAKQENAWQMQQTLSRIFQQQLPPLLDRCLSEASSPDCLHRIERLELDLGLLDGNRLEAELLEKIEAALRLALSEQIAPSQPVPVAAKQQRTDPAAAHLELFALFIREGRLPWWAESSQRQLPEKSFAALIDAAPNALARLLPKLIREPRSLQRLTGYFDDNHLIAMTALLCFAPQSLITSLLQTLQAGQAQVRQAGRVAAQHVRAALWQSLLQVAIAGDPVIFRHGEFLTAVMTRWAGLLGLSQSTLVDCLQQQLASRTVTDNEWRQALRLSASVASIAVLKGEQSALSPDEIVEADSESATAEPDESLRGSLVDRHRLIRNGYVRLKKIGDAAKSAQQKTGESLDAGNFADEAAHSLLAKTPITESDHPEDPASDETSHDKAPYRRRSALIALSNRYKRLKKTGGDYAASAQQAGSELLAEHRATQQSADELTDLPEVKTLLTKNSRSVNEQTSADMPDTGSYDDFCPGEGRGEGNTADVSGAKPAPDGQLARMQDDGTVAEVEQHSERLPGAVEDPRAVKNLAGLSPGEFAHEGEQAHTLKSTLLPGEAGLKSAGHDRLHTTTDDSRLTSVALSKRYAVLKKTGGSDAEKTVDTPITDNRISRQAARKDHDSLAPKRPAAKNRSPLDEQTGIDTPSDSSAFSDTDALYINNAGLCLLWPYLASFFERLELVQTDRFRNHAAKQCAVSLLHYLVAGDTEPPEYFLPFNKLLCAMAIDDVFELDTPLTTAQIEACDELLATVIDNAPVLNGMSINGFRGSFLLREGSLSGSEGCWLLRVERKTYDLVLEQFPWSWQWFKLPWMEHPFRVEW